MTRNEKILALLILLLFISVTIPFMPTPTRLRVFVTPFRLSTIAEFVKAHVMNLISGAGGI